LLISETVESLQYHLNIIHEIMEKNKKWVAVFSSSGGLATIIDLLSHKLKEE
jgi:flavorubredoxin